jgi:pyridoxamine 5'-phosphate oxidase
MHISLTDIVKNSWEGLENGSLQPGHPFRNMVISTQGDGNIGMATVVLRAVSAQDSLLIFYTDLRSNKVLNLRNNNSISILLYNDADKLQLILKGNTTLYNQDDVTAEHWDALTNQGKRSYMARPAPSSKINDPADGLDYINDDTWNDALIAGYQNFAVIKVAVNLTEYLKLSQTGHRRASFNLIKNKWEGSWLVP